MDFELNQSSVLSANGITPVRTAGDILIDFDFGGSGIPVLQLHRWVTSGDPTVVCEANNSVPCWDKAINLSGYAEASVNAVPVTDNNPPGRRGLSTGTPRTGSTRPSVKRRST